MKGLEGCAEAYLCPDPANSYPNPEYDLTADVSALAAVRVEKGENTKANDSESPANVILWAVPVEDLDRDSNNHAGRCYEHNHAQEIDSRSDGRSGQNSLEIRGKVI